MDPEINILESHRGVYWTKFVSILFELKSIQKLYPFRE